VTLWRSAAILALVLNATDAAAQMPWGGFNDAHIQAIEYRSGQVVRVRAAPGYQVTIELAPDERVESVALGDGSAFQVTANKAGNLLFVKPLQADIATNLTVITDVRTYNFELTGVAEASGDLPYTIRFTYPAVTMLGPQGLPGGLHAGKMIGEYKLAGDRTLRPAAISDDGVRTYIDWPADGPLPAVYLRERDGRETLTNGHMRGKFFVIDGVSPHLVFRIDRHRARADRLPPAAKE
jgi:type IV secretion system protein VirB9